MQLAEGHTAWVKYYRSPTDGFVVNYWGAVTPAGETADRKSTRLNSSHTEIYTLSLHDALPIYAVGRRAHRLGEVLPLADRWFCRELLGRRHAGRRDGRSEEHTSELQSHRDLHSFPTRRSSDLCSWPKGTPPG